MLGDALELAVRIETCQGMSLRYDSHGFGGFNKKIRENLWAIRVRFFTATDSHKFSRIIIVAPKMASAPYFNAML